DRLVDRHVDRAEMDRDPLVQRPLGRRVELLLVARLVGRERDRRQRQGEQHREAREALRHARASWPKYSTSDTASSIEKARAYTIAAASPPPSAALVDTSRRTLVT